MLWKNPFKRKSSLNRYDLDAFTSHNHIKQELRPHQDNLTDLAFSTTTRFTAPMYHDWRSDV